ncbi:MAG TPA: hypothetical protein VGI95_17870 [Caulobacteraceae bacterium]
MGKVQIGAAVGESLRFVLEAWRGAWGVLLLLVWVAAMLQAVEVLKSGWWPVSLLGVLILLFLTTLVAGALYRLKLSGDHPGDGAFAPGVAGFQWGGLEWRVLGANLLVGVAIGVVLFVAFIAWAFVLGASIQSQPDVVQAIQSGTDAEKTAAMIRLMMGPAGILSAAVLIPAAVGLLYLGARLALLTPLAADTRSFDIGKAWALTGGVTWAVIVGIVVIYVVEFAVGAIFRLVLGLGGSLVGQPQAAKIWVTILGQAIAAAINVPLFAGLQLYVYRAQRGDTAVAATFA